MLLAKALYDRAISPAVETFYRLSGSFNRAGSVAYGVPFLKHHSACALLADLDSLLL